MGPLKWNTNPLLDVLTSTVLLAMKIVIYFKSFRRFVSPSPFPILSCSLRLIVITSSLKKRILTNSLNIIKSYQSNQNNWILSTIFLFLKFNNLIIVIKQSIIKLFFIDYKYILIDLILLSNTVRQFQFTITISTHFCHAS